MNKYNIEGGIDFFSELYKSLDINEDNNEDDNKCLITNEILTDKYITLDCNHKFNYIPLYNDLVNHKLKYNSLEGLSGKLNLNEIRCPYCRQKQKNILPYYEELGLKKVNGVNFFDMSIKYNKYNNCKCVFKIPNSNFDINSPESETNQKLLNCHSYCTSKIMIYNSLNPSQLITYGDDNYYCYSHKKHMIKQYKLKEKEKEKEMKKQEKELQKAQLKAEKVKAKEEANAAKQAAKKGSKTENVVLGPSIIQNQTTNIAGCVQILKTGPKKGNKCGCKIVSDNMCKRHYSLVNKELININ